CCRAGNPPAQACPVRTCPAETGSGEACPCRARFPACWTRHSSQSSPSDRRTTRPGRRPVGGRSPDVHVSAVPLLLRSIMRKVLTQCRTAAMDAAAHGGELDAEGGADLVVGQGLDVAEHDGGAELRGQRVEGGLQV